MCCVYTLSAESSPEIVRYVGRSRKNNPNARFVDHLYKASHGSNLHVHNWMRKVASTGKDKVIVTCVEVAESYEESGQIEKHYIKYFRDLGHDLTNLTDGGEGRLGAALTEAQKKRVSEVHLGRKRSEETRKRISVSNKGKSRGKNVPKSEEHRKNIGEANKGKLLGIPLTEEHRKKLMVPWTKERKEAAPKKWSDLRRQRFIEKQKKSTI